MRHLRWTACGRTLEVSERQRAYKAQVNQRNVEVSPGVWAPYAWDGETLRYGDVAARFEGDRVWFGSRSTRLILERYRADGWQEIATSARMIRLLDEDELGPIARARVALELTAPGAAARLTFSAGGTSTAEATFELLAKETGRWRLVVEHELQAEPVRFQRLRWTGFDDGAWRVAWLHQEEVERTVRVVGRVLRVELPEVKVARRGSPAYQHISPDTFGPVTVTDANDGSVIAGTWFDNGDGENLFCAGDLNYQSAWRFPSVDLDGTPASIDSGTQLSCPRANTNSGANGGVRFKCEQSNTVAVYGTGDARPTLRTYINTPSDHTFPADGVTQNVSLVAAVGALRTAGYSYTGDASHAIGILAAEGAFWADGFANMGGSYRLLTIDSNAQLTIVYTPSGGGGEITGDLEETAPVPTESIDASVLVAGTLAETAPSPTEAIEGVVESAGTLAETAPSPTEAISGSVLVSGTLTETAPSPTEVIDGGGIVVTPFRRGGGRQRAPRRTSRG